jgi:hypothetical protein
MYVCKYVYLKQEFSAMEVIKKQANITNKER